MDSTKRQSEGALASHLTKRHKTTAQKLSPPSTQSTSRRRPFRPRFGLGLDSDEDEDVVDESGANEESAEHPPTGVLRGLHQGNIISAPSYQKTTEDADDDEAETPRTNASLPPASQHCTRASHHGRSKANYDMKYHPMDDVTRPKRAAKRKSGSRLGSASVLSVDLDREASVSSEPTMPANSDGDNHDPDEDVVDIHDDLSSRSVRRSAGRVPDPRATRHSARREARKAVSYSTREHPQDYALPWFKNRAKRATPTASVEKRFELSAKKPRLTNESAADATGKSTSPAGQDPSLPPSTALVPRVEFPSRKRSLPTMDDEELDGAMEAIMSDHVHSGTLASASSTPVSAVRDAFEGESSQTYLLQLEISGTESDSKEFDCQRKFRSAERSSKPSKVPLKKLVGAPSSIEDEPVGFAAVDYLSGDDEMFCMKEGKSEPNRLAAAMDVSSSTGPRPKVSKHLVITYRDAAAVPRQPGTNGQPDDLDQRSNTKQATAVLHDIPVGPDQPSSEHDLPSMRFNVLTQDLGPAGDEDIPTTAVPTPPESFVAEERPGPSSSPEEPTNYPIQQPGFVMKAGQPDATEANPSTNALQSSGHPEA